MHTSHGIATSTLVAFLWWASNNRNSSSQLLSSKQFLYRTEQERVRYPTYCRHVKSTSQYCPQSLIGKTMGTLIGYSVGSWHCSINISTIHHHLRHQRITTYVVKTNWQLLSECSKGDCKSTCNQTSNIVCSLFNISTSWSFSFFSSLDGDIENIPQSPLCVYLRYIYRYISHVESDMRTCGTRNLDRSHRHLKFWPLFHIVDTNICSSFSTRKLEEPVVVALQPRLRVLFVSNGLACVNALRATQATQNDGSRRTYTDGHILVCSQSWVQLTLTFIQHKACTSYKLPRTLTLRSCLSSISPTSPLADA